MDMTGIKNRLLAIRDKFQRIQLLTGSVDDEYDQSALDSLVAERGRLIDEITSEHKTLGIQDAEWERKARRNKMLSDLMQDIERTVYAIKSMDDTLAVLLNRQLAKIKAEMKGLYHHSRAAYAYATHTQTTSGRIA
jgi:hypothetical protein